MAIHETTERSNDRAAGADTQRPAAVLWADLAGRIVYANELASAIVGASCHDLLGRALTDVCPEFPLAELQRGKSPVRPALKAVEGAKVRRLHGADLKVELRALRTAGDNDEHLIAFVYPPDAWDDRGAGADDSVHGFLAAGMTGDSAILSSPTPAHGRDASRPIAKDDDTPTATSSAGPADRICRLLVENTSDLILLITRAGRIDFINRMVPGISRQQTIGSYVFDFVLPKYHGRLREALDRAWSSRLADRFDFEGLGTRAAACWYVARLGPVMEDNRVVGLMLTTRESEQRKRNEQTLREAHDELDRSVQRQSAELAQQAQRQAAIAEIGWLAVSHSELASLLERAAHRLGHVIGASYFVISERDGPSQRLVVQAVHPSSAEPGSDVQSLFQPAPELADYALEHGQPTVVTNAASESRFSTAALANQGVHSAVVVPLKLRERTYGVLGAYCTAPREFTAQDVRFLETAGHMLAGAIERDQAEQKMLESESRLRSLLENSPDAILLVDEQGTVLFANSSLPGLPQSDAVGRSAYRGLAEEYHERFSRALDRVFHKGKRDSLEHVAADGGWRLARVMPLKRAGATTAAMVISTDITRRKLADVEVEKSRRLLQQTLVAHEHDRQIISYEIHDGLVQDVTGALMLLESLTLAPGALSDAAKPKADIVLKLLRQTIDEGRRLISGLRPPIIDEMGIVAAIEYLINDQHSGEKLDVEFDHRVQFTRAEPLIEATLYRIAQEALTNIRRHSQSKRARIRLYQIGDRVLLQIRDWGVGFDMRKVQARRFGLQGMRQRAKLLKGRLKIESAPGKGTRLTAELPLHVSASDDVDE